MGYLDGDKATDANRFGTEDLEDFVFESPKTVARTIVPDDAFFKWGVGKFSRPVRHTAKLWDEDLHPRDDHGRYVSKDTMETAKTDPVVAEAIRSTVTNPKERAKLDKVLGDKTGAATTPAGHPRGADGKPVDKAALRAAMANPAAAKKLRASLPEAERGKLDKLLPKPSPRQAEHEKQNAAALEASGKKGKPQQYKPKGKPEPPPDPGKVAMDKLGIKPRKDPGPTGGSRPQPGDPTNKQYEARLKEVGQQAAGLKDPRATEAYAKANPAGLAKPPEVTRPANKEGVPRAGKFTVDPAVLAKADAEVKAAAAKGGAAMYAAMHAHPYYKEWETRIAQYGNTFEEQETWSMRQHTEDGTAKGKLTPERQALHDEIVGKLLNPEAKAAEGTRPKAFFIIGAPASGKTAGSAAMAERLGVKFTVVNPDEAKVHLPEYAGWNAGAVHEESAHIAERVQYEAIKAKHNVMVDITGKNDEKTLASAEKFAKEGYDVHVAYVQLPNDKTAMRAWDRFASNAYGKDPAKPPGRFVPPSFAGESVDGKPGKTYDGFKTKPWVKSWTKVSTDVPRGQPPQVLDEGQR